MSQQGLAARKETVRTSLETESYLIDSPTFERLPYWAKAVALVLAHYRKLHSARTDKKRKYFKAEKRDVYLVGLLNAPLYSQDIRLPNYPLTVDAVNELVRLVHDAYKETVGLLQAQQDFPTYTSATIEMRWAVGQAAPAIEKLARGDITIDALLELIETALKSAEGNPE